MKINGSSRTTLFLALHLVVIFIHSLFLASGETRDACINGAPLFDVIHNYTAEGIWPFTLFHFIDHNKIILVLTLIFVFILIRHSQRQRIFRRFLVFHSAMSLIRAVLIWLTTLPSPTSLCFERSMDSANIISRSISLTLGAIGVPHGWHNIGVSGMTCCDSIISGHTSMLLVLALIICSAVIGKRFKAFIWIFASLGMIGLLTPEWHYSIDVIITLIIGLLLYSWYINKVKYDPNIFINFIEEPSLYQNKVGISPQTITSYFKKTPSKK